MDSSVESSFRPSPRLAPRRGLFVATIALGLAVAASGGAIWLLAARHPGPWEAAFADLSNTSEICRAEGDATAHAATRVARWHGELDNFVRQRFDQFLASAKLAQDQYQREAQSRAARPGPNPAAADLARLESRLAELTAERSRLLERLTSQHPTVIDVERQITDVERQFAALAPALESDADRRTVAAESEMPPLAGWKELVDQSVVDYDQVAGECRRAERQFDEAQVGQSTALDGHLATLGRWSDAATAWGTRSATSAALGSGLWAVAAAALAVLGWLAARGMPLRCWPTTDRLITSAAQIESWFSLPVVAISAAGAARLPSAARARRPAPRWLVLPAQIAVAVAIFCLVATTIQNPSWLGDLWAR